MVETAKRLNRVNQVGYHNRFIDTFKESKRLLENNIIGKPYHFIGEAYGPVVLKSKGGTWRSNKKSGGGCVMDYAAHVLNLIDFVMGSTCESCAGTSMPSIFSAEVDDAVYSTLKLKNGLKGQLAVCWSDDTHRKMTTSISIEGDKGKIVADATTLKIYLKEDNEKEGLKKGWNTKYLTDFTPQVFFNLRGEEYSSQIDHFVQCIKNNTMEHRNTFEKALQTDLIINKLMEDADR
jgi:predicted dehydrogenase